MYVFSLGANLVGKNKQPLFESVILRNEGSYSAKSCLEVGILRKITLLNMYLAGYDASFLSMTNFIFSAWIFPTRLALSQRGGRLG